MHLEALKCNHPMTGRVEKHGMLQTRIFYITEMYPFEPEILLFSNLLRRFSKNSICRCYLDQFSPASFILIGRCLSPTFVKYFENHFLKFFLLS